MMDEQELSAEELKAKEYIDFYYFWKFVYCARNYEMELKSALPAYRVDGKEDDELLNTMIMRNALAQDIYWAHPLCSMNPQFDAYDGFVDTYGLFGMMLGSGELPTDLLKTTLSGENIEKDVTPISTDGLELLGTSGVFISSGGTLRGSLIARIDLNIPVSAIAYQLKAIKEAKFDTVPMNIGSIGSCILPESYCAQKKIIEETCSSSFSIQDDTPRVIGLWFWDVISGRNAMFNNFADAWKTICGDSVPKIERTDADDLFFYVKKDGHNGEIPIPSRDAFAKLGYAVSDPSVFRRLYRNTRRCIDACEVLSLKN